VDLPTALTPLLAELESLTPDRIDALARGFDAAEASSVRSTRRSVARHLALNPDTPDVISVLAGQLALSAAVLSWEAVYDLDQERLYAARAAVLDMGLVLSVASMARAGAEALAEPWLAAIL
jgi:hypothetical protein